MLKMSCLGQTNWSCSTCTLTVKDTGLFTVGSAIFAGWIKKQSKGVHCGKSSLALIGMTVWNYQQIPSYSLMIKMYTVKWEHFAEIKFQWWARAEDFAHLVFTVQLQFPSISLLQ